MSRWLSGKKYFKQDQQVVILFLFVAIDYKKFARHWQIKVTRWWKVLPVLSFQWWYMCISCYDVQTIVDSQKIKACLYIAISWYHGPFSHEARSNVCFVSVLLSRWFRALPNDGHCPEWRNGSITSKNPCPPVCPAMLPGLMFAVMNKFVIFHDRRLPENLCHCRLDVQSVLIPSCHDFKEVH